MTAPPLPVLPVRPPEPEPSTRPASETAYLEQVRFILALMMVEPRARTEYVSALGSFRLDEVFPGPWADVAKWILDQEIRLTLPMLLARFPGADLMDTLAHITGYDRSVSQNHLENFVLRHQVWAAERMGLWVNPARDIAEQLDAWANQLVALAQRRATSEEARGDVILARAKEALTERGLGYKPFGYAPFDKNLPGMDYVSGDLGVIFGPEKRGKTRTWLNLWLRYLINNPDLRSSILCTEPLVTPEKLLYRMWAMLAARAAEREGRVFDLSPTHLDRVAPEDMLWIDQAERELQAIGRRVYIYGPAIKHGQANYLPAAVALLQRDILAHGVRLVVVDNFQQIHVPMPRNAVPRDYDVMVAVVSGLIDRVMSAYQGVMLGVSQISREGFMRGGGGLADRLNFGIEPIPPEPGTDASGVARAVDRIKFECRYSRDTPVWHETVPILPFSGWLKEKE